MPRCEVKLSFRMLCFTLLCLVFIFSVILTNAFVDIDRYILNKIKGNLNEEKFKGEHLLKGDNSLYFKRHLYEEQRRNVEDYDDQSSYRTKRYLDVHNSTDIKMKYLIDQQLNALLEQMKGEKRQTTLEGTKLKNIVKINRKYQTKNMTESNEVIKENLIPSLNALMAQHIVGLKHKNDFIKNNYPSNLEIEKHKLKDPRIAVKPTIDLVTKNKHNSNESDLFNLFNEVVKRIAKVKLKRYPSNKQQNLYDTFEKTHNKGIVTKCSRTNYENNLLDRVADYKVVNEYNSVINRLLRKYLEKYLNTHKEVNLTSTSISRSKRHVKKKITYNFNDTNNVGEEKYEKKNDKRDDELYIEIQAHVDEKGKKKRKKKDLINNLVAKIQKAIDSDADERKDKKKTCRNHIHIKKRIQNPIFYKTKRELTKDLTYDAILPRQLDPITQANNLSPLSIGDNNRKVDLWHNYDGPSKYTQSAENLEIKTSYDNTYPVDIPERKQMPLRNTNVYQDPNDMKFYVSNVDGSGFSVGFNQYVDDPPDLESIKLFTGLENLIKTYHLKYDSPDMANGNNDEEHYIDGHGVRKRDINIKRRKQKDPNTFHENYKTKKFAKENSHLFEIRKESPKPYRNQKYLSEIYTKERRQPPNTIQYARMNIDKSITSFDSLKSLSARNKRSFRVTKLTEWNSKLKINQYLNKNKRTHLKKMRQKRQSKVELSKMNEDTHIKKSEENVFLVSDEDTYTPSQVQIELDKLDDSSNINFDVLIPPSVTNSNLTNSEYFQHILSHELSQEPLMSNYPHMFRPENKENNNKKENVNSKATLEIKDQVLWPIIKAILPTRLQNIKENGLVKNESKVKETHATNKHTNQSGVIKKLNTVQSIATTTKQPATTTEDIYKIKLLNTINQNENLTLEILQKMAKHTELMTLLIEKLTLNEVPQFKGNTHKKISKKIKPIYLPLNDGTFNLDFNNRTRGLAAKKYPHDYSTVTQNEINRPLSNLNEHFHLNNRNGESKQIGSISERDKYEMNENFNFITRGRNDSNFFKDDFDIFFKIPPLDSPRNSTDFFTMLQNNMNTLNRTI